MAAETSAMRTLARRVKQKALEKALDVFENPAKYTEEAQKETYLTVLKNAVPRSQEITGEDGEKLLIPIYGGLSKHDSNKEDIQPKEEN